MLLKRVAVLRAEERGREWPSALSQRLWWGHQLADALRLRDLLRKLIGAGPAQQRAAALRRAVVHRGARGEAGMRWDECERRTSGTPRKVGVSTSEGAPQADVRKERACLRNDGPRASDCFGSPVAESGMRLRS